ncbi:hypothetical protein ACNFJN_05505 [Xenorhabdus budapestensis]|uniref:hypothetical protein n=1 Tax=Xenorhabdus budapestensis TaxID=290110 RepID=UPI003A8A3467
MNHISAGVAGERLQCFDTSACLGGYFTDWYNKEHHHSGINYVTPGQRHRGEDKVILKQRDAVYRQAKLTHPERWSRSTRNWQWVETVTLNPEREKRAA